MRLSISCCSLIAWLLVMRVAQTTGQTLPDDPIVQGWAEHDEIVKCFQCHHDGPVKSPLIKTYGEFSRQVEAKLWFEHDKHAIARQRIEPLSSAEIAQQSQQLREDYGQDFDVTLLVGPSNDLSRTICQRLGFDVNNDAGYQQFRESCLTCHAGYRPAGEAALLSRSEQGQPGVSCVNCHQLGELSPWVDAHSSPTKWRMLSSQAKAEAGMRHLVSEAAQADLCADCHVGNLRENKFVTHAMYAAGHPPLPNFEAQTFCSAMPQHWQTPDELYQSLADFPARLQYFAENYPGVFSNKNSTATPATISWRTRKLLIGGLQARRHWLQLIIDAADSANWGDYALYDCMACHHELRRDSPRQQFAATGVPGRPRQLLWTTILAEVAAGQTTVAANLTSCEADLAAAFDRQPFGEPTACAEAARAALDALNQVASQLEPQPLESKDSRTVLWKLAQTPTPQLVDYLSARQVVWGMQQVTQDVTWATPAEIGVPPMQQQPWMGISTQLPSGRARSIYPGYLTEELQVRARYSPEELAAKLTQIRQRLEALNP